MSPRPHTEPSPSRRAEELLLEFLADNDAPCPVCGYNLRGLSAPICPECQQHLVLSVGHRRLRLRWLLLALAPGYFAGIAACFAVLPTIGTYIEDGRIYPPAAFAVLFGWSSGALAILLGVKRTRFLAQSLSLQRCLALALWIAHIAAFIILVALMAPYWS